PEGQQAASVHRKADPRLRHHQEVSLRPKLTAERGEVERIGDVQTDPVQPIFAALPNPDGKLQHGLGPSGHRDPADEASDGGRAHRVARAKASWQPHTGSNYG